MNLTAKQARQRRWFEENRAHCYAKASQWARDNRVKANEMAYRWQRENPEAIAAIRAKYKANHPDIGIYNMMRQRAKRRGVPCELTLQQLERMVSDAKLCPILGIALERAKGKPTNNSPSLDCFYPALGYVPGNVFVISYRANMLKNNATVEEVRALLGWMEATTVVIDATKE